MKLSLIQKKLISCSRDRNYTALKYMSTGESMYVPSWATKFVELKFSRIENGNDIFLQISNLYEALWQYFLAFFYLKSEFGFTSVPPAWSFYNFSNPKSVHSQILCSSDVLIDGILGLEFFEMLSRVGKSLRRKINQIQAEIQGLRPRSRRQGASPIPSTPPATLPGKCPTPTSFWLAISSCIPTKTFQRTFWAWSRRIHLCSKVT